jgi:phosphate transport system ATP-binding protein
LASPGGPDDVARADSLTRNAPIPGMTNGLSPTALAAEDLNAWFGSLHVLKDVNMTAKARAVTALIGPSGSGKSTLIRCFNRMHEEVRGAKLTGQVVFGGNDLYAPDIDPVDVRRRIGMVFQRPTPFPTMSVMENAVAGLKLGSRLGKGETQARGEEALRRAGLWDEVKDRLHHPGGGLSGGQQQRLCIARAIAVQPELLLMDEPASALDPGSTARIEELIEKLKTEYTVVIVTHNLQQATRVADDTVFMLDGEIIESGPTETIFNHPADKRTDDYVNGRFG